MPSNITTFPAPPPVRALGTLARLVAALEATERAGRLANTDAAVRRAARDVEHLLRAIAGHQSRDLRDLASKIRLANERVAAADGGGLTDAELLVLGGCLRDAERLAEVMAPPLS